MLGDHAQARNYYAESLEISRTIGDRRWTSANLNGLGLTLVEIDAYGEAGAVLAESLLLARAIGSKPDALDALATTGDLMAGVGQGALARQLWHYVDAHPKSMSQARERCRERLARHDAGEQTVDRLEIGAGLDVDPRNRIGEIIDRVHTLLLTTGDPQVKLSRTAE